MAVQEYEGVIINKLTLTKYKELKAAGQLVASQTYVIEDYLGDYTYICNGSTDNVEISNIVKAFLNGGTDYRTIKLNVIGTIGMTAPANGNGSTTTYGWFDFDVETNRRVHIDFSNCSQINVPVIAGKTNVVFKVRDVSMTNANVVANNTSTNSLIYMFYYSTSKIYCENCRFWINGSKDSIIAYTGTFVNCRGSVTNGTTNSYCFLTTGVLRLIGGEYYSYTGNSSLYSAIVGQSGANAVSILYGVNAPTVARDSYFQTHAIRQFDGMLSCTDIISNLTLQVASGKSNVRGTIQMSKPDLM